jgi:2-succinyl-5-enolpyruvyl-6-hydroxy-3-cyclohexene-1-carboxylate synthase
MRYQPIFDIAELCVRKGVKHAVLCPGSRCAPLTLAFTRNAGIEAKTFSDERSAAFVAMGMAQQTTEPVVLICTSGSAAYNFAPAIAEAFFSETPLIIFTADRPLEWVAQHDGQTIFQHEIFGKHVKKSYVLPQDYDYDDSAWAINRIVNEAINVSKQEPKGPVHINAPFREPLYPGKDEVTEYSKEIRVLEEITSPLQLAEKHKEEIQKATQTFKKILIVAGQHDYDKYLQESLLKCAIGHHIPVVADIISNLNETDYPVKHSDLFLGQASDGVKKSLQPDLLITYGKSLISKNLKLFLRKYSAIKHWHIQAGGSAADTFKNVTQVFHTHPVLFFNDLGSVPRHENFETQKQFNYSKLWEVEERRAVRCLSDFFPLQELNELELVQQILTNLPADTNLHLANSMSVRYANFIGLEAAKNGVKVFSNRGTSGIDGCSSTTVGHALTSNELNVLITGDLAFFYDRNAFWHNYPLPNLRIVLLNNHGGSIFNMIDGPASQPEASEYFITQQKLNAQKLTEEFGFEYLKLDNTRKTKNLVKDFFDKDGKTRILELESDLQLNRTIFDNLKQKIKKNYES